MTTDSIMAAVSSEFQKILQHLKDEYSRLQMGRANPSMIENIVVEMYGVNQPIKAVGSISVPEPRTLVIQPWDKSALAAIEKAIVGVGLGLNPVNDGTIIRINFPALTEERRKDLTKHVKQLAEKARISVRTARQDGHSKFKEMKNNDQLTEDDLRFTEKKLQEKVDQINGDIDKLATTKEQDVMTV